MQDLYGAVSSRHLLYLPLGRPQIWVGPDGDSLALAGQHSGWGYCWCQPRVVRLPGRDGVWRPRVTHRRVADMTDTEFDALHPGAGWDVDQDGDVYPAGDRP